jgi:hypothetical protein
MLIVSFAGALFGLRAMDCSRGVGLGMGMGRVRALACVGRCSTATGLRRAVKRACIRPLTSSPLKSTRDDRGSLHGVGVEEGLSVTPGSWANRLLHLRDLRLCSIWPLDAECAASAFCLPCSGESRPMVAESKSQGRLPKANGVGACDYDV